MAATPMTGGEALVRSLYQEGVRVVFGLPGVQLYGVMAALRDEPRIRFVNTRHEQATSFMADGYARAGGSFGTALVVPGPGLLERDVGPQHRVLRVVAGADDLGPGPARQHRQGRRAPARGERPAGVHPAGDQVAPARAPGGRRASRGARGGDPAADGRPRPVEIEMPPETMEDEGLVELLPPVEVRPQVPSGRDLDRAVEALLAARRPLIYAGGGVHLSGAHEALGQAAEHLQAGVAQSAEGKGAVSDHNSLSLGAALWRESALRAHVQEADVVLAVGSRLAQVTFKPGTRIVQIDADEQEIGRNHKDTLGLVGDARATLEALLERLRAAAAPRTSRKAEHEALRPGRRPRTPWSPTPRSSSRSARAHPRTRSWSRA
jgi:acetolactate synthase-1/2/3 large subunit